MNAEKKQKEKQLNAKMHRTSNEEKQRKIKN